jgi:hypothetical protein
VICARQAVEPFSHSLRNPVNIIFARDEKMCDSPAGNDNLILLIARFKYVTKSS